MYYRAGSFPESTLCGRLPPHICRCPWVSAFRRLLHMSRERHDRGQTIRVITDQLPSSNRVPSGRSLWHHKASCRDDVPWCVHGTWWVTFGTYASVDVWVLLWWSRIPTATPGKTRLQNAYVELNVKLYTLTPIASLCIRFCWIIEVQT